MWPVHNLVGCGTMDEREFYSIVESQGAWAFSHLSRAETKEVTHSYHQYPAKFIPQLARALIENYTDVGDLIWDSYCGSGTLNVEAFRTNRHSIGTDINPTAVLISRAKTTPLEPAILSTYKRELLEDINANPIQSEAFYISKGALNGNVDVLRKWFSSDSLLELGHILWHIREKKSKRRYREFSLCAFSSILKKSSYWLSSSVKSQIDPDKKPEKPLVYFERQLRTMERANNIFYLENRNNKTEVEIFKHNAKHRLPSRVQQIDCIITSPPYLISYDYSDIFKLSTYSLFSRSDYGQFRKEFVGTPLKRSKLGHTKVLAPYQSILNSIGDVGLRRALTQYYEDMSMYFRNAHCTLKENGRLIMVVGDTKLRGVKIPNAYLLAEIANRIGWSLEAAYTREIPIKILPTIRDMTTGRFTNKANGNSSEGYDKEYVLVFRRQNK